MIKAWEEQVVIPTYEVGESEKLPIFLEKRVYQGSSGTVYPYPVIERVADQAVDKTYQALFLENDYLKIMLLPELGGRVQMAWDKIGKRHFIYYNQVIKPALVGLAGPWISGGIEINWPQHHRPSTFRPVDHLIVQNSDGSITAWMNEMEIMTHQKGMIGYTLHPDKAYLEIKGRAINRSPFPQTFLWWANPAVKVNDQYQSVFPPDVHAVFDHGKRDVSTFPIATGTYYKVDYSAGVDISNYKNIPVPTSYMAIRSIYNFVGGYENDTKAGVLHVADHHVSPGKKQWTWGNGDFGKAWDRNLTDEDGPYIELMAGVYTDNQPDFSWLQPYEEKSFSQYFFPYRELGVVKNASKDFLIQAEETEKTLRVGVFATSVSPSVTIQISSDGRLIEQDTADLSPKQVYWKTIRLPDAKTEHIKVSLRSDKNVELLSWESAPHTDTTIPEAAKPALLPEAVATNEDLFLTGLHLEQYRHATYDASDYYREALRRDPSDLRNNNALGLWLMRRGEFEEALGHFEKAVQTLQSRNPNPYDGEPLYQRGICLQYLERWDEAYDSLQKSCWNAAWQDAGYFALARISCRRGHFERALDEIERSLNRNASNHQARHLKTTILRHLGRTDEALELIGSSLKIDPFNDGCLFERYLLQNDPETKALLKDLVRGDANNVEAIALDYAAAGLFEEALQWFSLSSEWFAPDALNLYYKAWMEAKAGRPLPAVVETLKQATLQPERDSFPNRLEAIQVLAFAMETNPDDARAPYYLGNLWYDKRRVQRAVRCWETSAAINPAGAEVRRNLALATYNKLHDEQKAVALMEEAFRLEPTSARMLMELDQLYKKTRQSLLKRLQLLNQHPTLVKSRDDLTLERITLLNLTGAFVEAKEAIDNRIFHPWEGGEGKVSFQYQYARMELAKDLISRKECEEALRLLEECLFFPPNLGEGKLYGARENDIRYLMGCAYETAGNQAKASECWEMASKGSTDPTAAIFYNDQKPEHIFYQAMALSKIGRKEESLAILDKLIHYGETHQNDVIRMDYFAVSLPDLLIWEDDLSAKNGLHCQYLQGLGYLGKGEREKGEKILASVKTSDPAFAGIGSLL